MRNTFSLLFLISLILSTVSPLIAGGIDNKTNFSAEYIRTLSRNAATDSADAVVYNPAGVMEMQNGTYINFPIQYIFKTYSNTVAGNVYATENPSIVPSLLLLHKRDQLAGYFAATVVGGGGKVDYKYGSTTTIGYGTLLTSNPALNPPYDIYKNQHVEAESVYKGYLFGGAYKLNPMVSILGIKCRASISLGIRYVDAAQSAKASLTLDSSFVPAAPDMLVTLDYEKEADGLGGIIGLNLDLEGPLNIGIRYETGTNLNFKTTVNKDTVPGGSGLSTGDEGRRDLPGILGIGAAYTASPNLRLDASLTYYFNTRADWEWEDRTDDDTTNGYDVGFSAEYTFNEKLKGSAGYMYTSTGIDPDHILAEAPELDAHSIGYGILYKIKPNVDLNFGVLKVFYSDLKEAGVKYEKEVATFAAGIQYKFD